MIEAPKYFISCDWGTTNFRLRVVSTKTLSVLVEHATDQGVRELNHQFTEGVETDRLRFFADYLQSQLQFFPTEHQQHPVIVSGMASANIGMLDLPYGDLPIEAGGTSFIYQDLDVWIDQPLRLISGVKSKTGMIRGEETQALGLLKQLEKGEDGVLILPGTHSKHLTYASNKFTNFTSFMTGEIFEVLSQKSILANSVLSGKWTVITGDRFRAGVLAGNRDGVTPHLFSVRAGHILQQTNLVENFYYLSGLLIGDELSYLPNDKRVYLAGSGALLRLYRFALEVVAGLDRLTLFQGEALERALLVGQRDIILRQ